MYDIEDRFWDKVNRDGAAVRAELGQCWEWTGRIDEKGYGRFMWRKPLVVRAHRASWLFANDDWPVLCVLHRCDNRRCVRPSHLFLGTNADNNADMIAKGRNRGAPGERNRFRAKLTASDVVDIRSLHAFGATPSVLRGAFGISQQMVSAVIRREVWRHI